MPMGHYDMIKKIGAGSFGSAWLCHKSGKPEPKFVMKLIDMNGMSPDKVRGALQEADVLREVSSPFIVKYVDAFVHDSQLAIAMEYCGGGDLDKQIEEHRKSGTPYFENEVKVVLHQLATALHRVHSTNIIHRDVKAENVFISSDGRYKLGDFGVSRVLRGEMDMAKTNIGTPYYASPEMCKENAYSFQSDIWALGVLMYEVMNFHRPFENEVYYKLCQEIIKGEFKPIRKSLVFYSCSHLSFHSIHTTSVIFDYFNFD